MGSRTPVVADYDDAVFHRYDLHPSRMMRLLLGHSVDWEMRRAALVIAGNQYLAQRAQVAGARRIEILPTVIDLKRYAAAVPRPLQERIFTVGWIGTPHTAGDLETLRPVLREFCRDGQARFLAIGAGPLDWPDVPVVVVPWSEESEVEDLQMADVGIMPVPDSPWERGKCGLKLLQYMASCRPVIASPVGVNRELVSDGVNGFLATTSSEWLVALRTLQEDSNLRCRMGLAGRSLIEGNYSLEVAAPKLARLMANLLRETRS
jgi:glycosyltransferase involved in cell wall biosynthesis